MQEVKNNNKGLEGGYSNINKKVSKKKLDYKLKYNKKGDHNDIQIQMKNIIEPISELEDITFFSFRNNNSEENKDHTFDKKDEKRTLRDLIEQSSNCKANEVQTRKILKTNHKDKTNKSKDLKYFAPEPFYAIIPVSEDRISPTFNTSSNILSTQKKKKGFGNTDFAHKFNKL